MVTAELSHNPYLLLTSVKFNGQAPRVNSQIEKYEHQPLKDWVHLIPSIFHDEMNGYDFDLLFTGTVPDFEEVKLAFKFAGIQENEVRLIHINEIEDVTTKNNEVDSLIKWLQNNKNRKFDFAAFWNENLELFEGAYAYYVLGGPIPDECDSYIEIEAISSANELSSTVLTNAPILFYVSNNNLKQFRKDLPCLISRNDIRQEQFFFMIHPELNINQITRIIEDLGVTNPQVVTTYFDEIINKFILNYPISEYIRDAISVFEKVTDDIESVLAVENHNSVTVNANTHAKIDKLETRISLIKQADNNIVQRDRYVVPKDFAMAKQELKDQIQKWHNRKATIIGDVEAEKKALEFDIYLALILKNFTERINQTTQSAARDIHKYLQGIYTCCREDTSYSPKITEIHYAPDIPYPSLFEQLIALKSITFEESKNDLLGLFKIPSDHSPEQRRVVTSYLVKWRSKAEEVLLPLADRYISDNTENLVNFYHKQSEDYHKHLTDMLSEILAEKEKAASMLSEDEKKLQEDNDWLVSFKDQLIQIERA